MISRTISSLHLMSQELAYNVPEVVVLSPSIQEELHCQKSNSHTCGAVSQYMFSFPRYGLCYIIV
jgi:hypothetical protein